MRRVLASFLFVGLLLARALVAAPPEAGPARGEGTSTTPAPAPDLVRVDVLDVGQGDSILIRSSNGKTVLVDTGDRKAERTLLGQLKRAGVTRVDALVLTHPHADHIGNAVAVMEAFEVGIVYEPGYPHTSATYRRVLEVIQKKGLRYKKARAGMRLKMSDQVELTLLSPPATWIHSDRSILNTNSVVLRLDAGTVRVLLAGDSEEETEKHLAEVMSDALRADILKVAHHGSRYSSKDAWLDRVRPRVALISLGAGNSYGHPHRPLMERLKARRVQTYTTEVHGTLSVHVDGTGWRVETTRDTPPF